METSTELDEEIRDFFINYCDEQEKADNVTSRYGVAASSVYHITTDFNWYIKYLNAFIRVKVFNSEEDSIERKLMVTRGNKFIEALDVIISG